MPSAADKIHPRIIAVGVATPPKGYSQRDILDMYRIENPQVRRIFENSHIQNRFLYLPPVKDGMPAETGGELIAKHLRGARDMGRRAVEECLQAANLDASDIDYFVTVSSTGFLCPGISAHLITDMGMRENTHRADMVGMGCNAGVNGMMSAAEYAQSHPGARALMLCCEVCSAAYIHNETLGVGVVNSLFGDGSAAILLEAAPDKSHGDGPKVLGFESHIIPTAIDAMKFEQVDGRLSFYLDREIPYIIGAEVSKPIGRLLNRFGLKKRDISHWVIHSGGKKVLDSIKYNLGLSDYDIRHTKEILRTHGNMSSGSFLFSYRTLIKEGITRKGDFGLAMAMGPGTRIETALLQW